jgi:SAM-dependent methyltransferase
MSEEDAARVFPNWESLYQNQPIESMPWYNVSLDDDLKRELDERKIREGNFLDLGTGTATQAVRLSEIGFTVTASDLSETAIRKASISNSKSNSKINFVVDDILNSGFTEGEFDFIFDRGCFHVLSPIDRLRYANEVKRILKEDGLLFLKCFSDREPMREAGPYRFSVNMIRDFFASKGFEILSIRETVYQGTLNPLPKALFVVMAKEKERRVPKHLA